MSIIDSVISGMYGNKAQSSANRTNIALMREANAFSERMSSTALQRSALDAEKAGLNRILALGKPASTPDPKMAQVQSGIPEKAQYMLAMAQSVKLLADAKNSAANARWTENKIGISSPAGEIGKGIGAVMKGEDVGVGKDGGYKPGFWGQGRRAMAAAFEMMDIGGIKKTSALDSWRKDQEQRHWYEEPKRIEAKLRQLRRQLEWGDEHNIWNVDNKASRKDLVKKIKELEFQLKVMKGPKE